MKIEPEICGVSIALVGNFNPAIFNPDWFVRRDIVDSEAYKRAEIGVIHPDIAEFSLDWINVRVEKTKAVFESTSAPWVRINDIVIKTFRDYLPQTPVTRFGINMSVHFEVGTFKQRKKMGDLLAPKGVWGDWAHAANEEKGGLISLTTRLIGPDDRPAGHVDVKVEPSIRLGKGRTGVYISVNDHYEMSEDGHQNNVVLVCDLIEKCFDESLTRSEAIVDHLMGLADA